ncbi:MAG: glycosyltransferase [Bacillota bacterium]|jgi:glycosyltransferase involved in cell wall biosynthesis
MTHPDAPLRVLTVTNMYPSAARPYFGIFVKRQVEAAREAGVEMAVEVIAADRGEADYFLARGRIARAIREFQPDLLHCHYGYTPLAAAFTGVPYLLTLCGDDLNGQADGHGGLTMKSTAGIFVSQVFAAAARHVIVKSEAMRRDLWPVSRAKTDVLPNGVDTRIFLPGSRAEARARLGLPATGLVIGFVNSVGQATKRLDVAEAVRDELTDRRVAARLLVAESVPADEMPWHYRASDCLLVTSDSEGAPNVVKEALACGVPVVSVPVGDVAEVLEGPAMGAIAPRDPHALADAIEALAPGGDVRPSLLPERFTSEAMVRRLLAIYRHCIA